MKRLKLYSPFDASTWDLYDESNINSLSDYEVDHLELDLKEAKLLAVQYNAMQRELESCMSLLTASEANNLQCNAELSKIKSMAPQSDLIKELQTVKSMYAQCQAELAIKKSQPPDSTSTSTVGQSVPSTTAAPPPPLPGQRGTIPPPPPLPGQRGNILPPPPLPGLIQTTIPTLTPPTIVNGTSVKNTLKGPLSLPTMGLDGKILPPRLLLPTMGAIPGPGLSGSVPTSALIATKFTGTPTDEEMKVYKSSVPMFFVQPLPKNAAEKSKMATSVYNYNGCNPDNVKIDDDKFRIVFAAKQNAMVLKPKMVVKVYASLLPSDPKLVDSLLLSFYKRDEQKESTYLTLQMKSGAFDLNDQQIVNLNRITKEKVKNDLESAKLLKVEDVDPTHIWIYNIIMNNELMAMIRANTKIILEIMANDEEALSVAKTEAFEYVKSADILLASKSLKQLLQICAAVANRSNAAIAKRQTLGLRIEELPKLATIKVRNNTSNALLWVLQEYNNKAGAFEVNPTDEWNMQTFIKDITDACESLSRNAANAHIKAKDAFTKFAASIRKEFKEELEADAQLELHKYLKLVDANVDEYTKAVHKFADLYEYLMLKAPAEDVPGVCTILMQVVSLMKPSKTNVHGKVTALLTFDADAVERVVKGSFVGVDWRLSRPARWLRHVVSDVRLLVTNYTF